MKSHDMILFGLILASSLLRAGDGKTVDEAFLNSLRTEAARNHPAAKSSVIRAAAASSDLRTNRLWEDPMIGLSIMAASQEMRSSDGDFRLSFEQPLPRRSLYTASVSKAEALRRAAVEDSRSSLLEVGAMAAKDAIELALADESVTLQTAQITWLESMAENAREMSLNPASTSIDALRLESELAREKQVLEAAYRTRASIAQSLNLRLGRSLESPWKKLSITLNPAPTPVARSEIARIARINPKVRSMKEIANAANSETHIAESERSPQFSVGFESSLYSGGDVRSAAVGLKMSLPFFNRPSYDAKIEASKLRENAAVKDIESTRLAIAAEVLAAVTDAANAAAQARAYSGDIYQRTLAATQSVEAAWISSKAPLTDLLDSKRILFSIQLEQRRFVAMQLVALENLNLLVPRN